MLKVFGILSAVLGTALTFTLASKPQQAAKPATSAVVQSSIVQPTSSASVPNLQRQRDRTQDSRIAPLFKQGAVGGGMGGWGDRQKLEAPKCRKRCVNPKAIPPVLAEPLRYRSVPEAIAKKAALSKAMPHLIALPSLSPTSSAWEDKNAPSASNRLQHQKRQPPHKNPGDSGRQQQTALTLSAKPPAHTNHSWQTFSNLAFPSAVTLKFSQSVQSQREVFSQVPKPQQAESGVETNSNQNQPRSTSNVREVVLTLSDVVILALENNRPIKNAYLERIAQRQELAVAEDIFNPNLTPTVSVSVAQLGSTPTTTDADLGLGATVSLRIPTGGELSFSWATNSQPLSSNGLNIDSNDNPFGQNLQLRFSQPLLRGAGINVNRASIDIARLSEQINILNLKSILINTITEAIVAYRELLRAQEQFKIAQLSLQSARESLENYRILIQAGRLAPVDIVQAETNIANRQVRLIEAENDLAASRLALLNILDIDQNTVIVPADSPQATAVSLNADKLKQLAFGNQPDYLRAQLDIERTKLGLLQAENNRLWDLNLNTSYSYTLSDNNDVRVGLGLSRQLGDLTAERDFQRSRINQLQAENTLEEQRESLEIQLKDRIRDVQLSFSQVQLAQKATQLSERQLEIAREKQRLGRDITVFELIRLEDDLVQARNVELNATIDYLNALTRLDQTLGTTLDTWKVTLGRK